MDNSNKPIPLTYSSALVHKAVFKFWRKAFGGLYWFAVVMIAGSIWATFEVQSWWTGFALSMLVIGIAFPLLAYAIQRENALAKLKDMKTPVASLVLRPDDFTVSSQAGSSTLPWSSVKEIRQHKNFWLLVFSKAQFSTLPLQTLNPDQKAFILERVRAAGGKIC